MPAGGFKTFTAGSVLTASDVNSYLMQGVLVFTTETARDTAITSPVEGMIAYLTAPAVPAATGGTTAVPTGVRTIYNGTNWVCVTPVGAYTNNAGTTTSTSFTATLSGTPGTNPSVTLVTGTIALVTLSGGVFSTTTGDAYIGVAVSGAGTVAASTAAAMSSASTAATRFGITFVLTGLTAGTNTFTLQYQAGAFTGNYSDRRIAVQGIA